MPLHEICIRHPSLNFSSAHFLCGHPTCSRIHGHNYFVAVELKGELDEETFMVLDFHVVREAAKSVCDRFDHRLIVPTRSPLLKVSEVSDGSHVSPGGSVAI